MRSDEEKHRRQRAVRDIVRTGQEIERLVDRLRYGARFQLGHQVVVLPRLKAGGSRG